MKLAAWRAQENKTQEWVAEQLGVSQPYISNIERSRSPLIPGSSVIVRAYVMSDGAIMPNDWFDLPELPRERRLRLSEPCLPGIDQDEAA